ncbi:hypothetical protein [Chitinivibrio alkaliphilus]|uniref:Uncharacterized protein n=1 Tax=Chitinivibrio alkaliphilus ACht1 TaxID=1313304 RepID=U7D5D3_9BACT|nr:hypothetical protein [Chitinivibrio alkaliphilus]ERP31158.1 hypothetical protein CALK_1956 [Chitinivibrio alkaliphilus ACht1]
MKQLILSSVLVVMCLSSGFARTSEFRRRSLLKESAYFVSPDGTITPADFWSLGFGRYTYTVEREFPGEGHVPVSGESSIALVSSGYIDGPGYGDRGDMRVRPHFVYEDEHGEYHRIELEDIKYLYMGGTQVVLQDGTQHEVFLRIESDDNIVQPQGMQARTFKMDESDNRLVPQPPLNPVIGFSYSREGAQKAHQAALDAAGE